MRSISWDAHFARDMRLRRRLRWFRERFLILLAWSFAVSSRNRISACHFAKLCRTWQSGFPCRICSFWSPPCWCKKKLGGNLAEVLDKAAAVIRERSRLMGQLRIYTAQGRMTGWILGLLPFIVFAAMSFVNRNYARNLIDDPIGRKAIWIGLGLMTIGVFMIRKIVDIKV